MRSWRILAPARRPMLYALAGAIFAIAAVNESDLQGPLGACDIDQAWAAGRALLEHENPYQVIGPGAHYQFPWPLYYPLTVGVVALPSPFFRSRWRGYSFC